MPITECITQTGDILKTVEVIITTPAMCGRALGMSLLDKGGVTISTGKCFFPYMAESFLTRLRHHNNTLREIPSSGRRMKGGVYLLTIEAKDDR